MKIHRTKRRIKHHANKRINHRTKRRIRKFTLYCLFVFFLAVLFVSGYKFLKEIDNRFAVFNSSGDYESETIEYNGEKYKLNKNVETYAVLGVDKFANEYIKDEDVFRNDEQTDLVLLLVLDNKEKTMSLLHINRDTMVSIDTYGVNGAVNGVKTAQLALSHTYGNGGTKSCLNTCNSVSKLLKGVTVNKFIALNMGAVAEFNDLIGGVEVTVLNDFSGIDNTLKKGETVLLKGEKALTYVRSRQGMDDETNASRMLRQQQYMEAFYKTAAKAYADDDKLSVTVAKKLDDGCVSNCSVGTLNNLTEHLAEYTYKGIMSLEGEYKTTDHVEFYPSESSLTETVIKLFYTK